MSLKKFIIPLFLTLGFVAHASDQASSTEYLMVKTSTGKLIRHNIKDCNLSIICDNITSLPTEIGHLTPLNVLTLTDIKLRSLPTQLGALTNLRTLNLFINNITVIPTEIGLLNKLENLVLSDNQLSCLPTEIGHLTSLTRLNLGKNNLTSIPREIGKCANLGCLHLCENQLIDIPCELVLIQKLRTLSLHQNPPLKNTIFKEWVNDDQDLESQELESIKAICRHRYEVRENLISKYLLLLPFLVNDFRIVLYLPGA